MFLFEAPRGGPISTANIRDGFIGEHKIESIVRERRFKYTLDQGTVVNSIQEFKTYFKICIDYDNIKFDNYQNEFLN